MAETTWTDEEMLEALHLTDAVGLSHAEVGAALWRARNAVAGILHRVRADLAASEAGDPDPRRHDGALPPEWWRDGLEARA